MSEQTLHETTAQYGLTVDSAYASALKIEVERERAARGTPRVKRARRASQDRHVPQLSDAQLKFTPSKKNY